MKGHHRPIKWIGQRSYSGRFALGKNHLLPICIKQGAIADNVPARDLWISPHHAMYLNGVLVEARHLVNGVNVVRAERVDEVSYFHIELDSHDVLVAEGSFSESFVDDDSRNMFHNAAKFAELYPGDRLRRGPARYCAPRPDEGFELEAARRQIKARAGLRARSNEDPGPLSGYVDVVSVRTIEGWAQSVDHPDAAVCLDIIASGKLIGRTLANRYREDLKAAGIGSGYHGFRFAVPAGVRIVPTRIEVRRSVDGAIVACSDSLKIA